MLHAGEVANPAAVQTEELSLPRGVHAFLAVPTSSVNHPGLVLIHEAFGLNDHIKDVARRLANAGFTTLAPDLYSRSGAPDPTDYADVSAKVLSIRDEDCIQDIEAAASYLRTLRSSTGRVGVVGFCSGGRNALLMAAQSDMVNAAVDCWGGFITKASSDAVTTPERPVPPMDLADSLRCPVLAVVGEEDTEPSPAVLTELEAKARAAGRDLTLRVYAKAGHAFFADYRTTYVESAAFALWPEMLAFLHHHLD